jgi:hypothetical protein
MTNWKRGREWLTGGQPRWRRPVLLALVLCAALLLWLSFWVGTCGFYGCPSTSQIQAFRPSEGSQVRDRTRILGGSWKRC